MTEGGGVVRRSGSTVAPLGVLVVASGWLLLRQVHVLDRFGLRVTDEDQALLWHVSQDLAAGQLYEPFFPGQAYGSSLDAVLAAPMNLLGAEPQTSLPVAATVFLLAMWGVLAAWAGRRAGLLSAAAVVVAGGAMPAFGVLVASRPTGMTPGITLATVAAVLLVASSSGRAMVMGGFLVGLAFAFNGGSILVTLPALSYAAVRAWRPPRSLSSLRPLLAGLVGGGLVFVALRLFYVVRPDYDLHPLVGMGFDPSALWRNLRTLEVFVDDWVPSLGAGSVPVLLALVVVLVGLAWRRRAFDLVAYVGAAFVALALLLALPKSENSFDAIFLTHGRVTQALPATLVIGFVLLARPPGGERTTPGRPIRSLGVSAALACAVGVMAVASIDALHEEMATARLATYPIVPESVAQLTAGCDADLAAVRVHDVGLLVYLKDRVRTYACSARHHGELQTFFPLYERRTWRLQEEERVARARFLVADAEDDFCSAVTSAGADCEVVGRGHRGALVVVSGVDGPVVPFLRSAGVEMIGRERLEGPRE